MARKRPPLAEGETPLDWEPGLINPRGWRDAKNALGRRSLFGRSMLLLELFAVSNGRAWARCSLSDAILFYLSHQLLSPITLADPFLRSDHEALMQLMAVKMGYSVDDWPARGPWLLDAERTFTIAGDEWRVVNAAAVELDDVGLAVRYRIDRARHRIILSPALSGAFVKWTLLPQIQADIHRQHQHHDDFDGGGVSLGA